MPSNGDLPRGVYEAPPIDPPEKASMTLLSKISDCPYSGRLYLELKGGAQSHQMARGEAVHAAIEECLNLMIETGEMEIPPEVAKDHLQAILDERVDLALSPAEHDIARAAVWNWASGFAVNPASVVGVETMLEAEVAGWKVRGKIDLALIDQGDGAVYDWKTSLSYPTQEQHEQDFQMLMYGLLMLEGVPEGETTPLGKGLAGVHLNAHFPRIPGDNGYFTRHSYKNRAEVHDFRRTLEAALAKLDHGLKTNQWKASPGSWCSFCPAMARCPIPREQLPDVIATQGQAEEAGERIIVLEAELKELKSGAKRWVENEIPIRVGDEEFVLVSSESESARSKEDVKAAIRQGGLNPEDYFKTTRSMRFKRQKVKT